MIAVPNGTVNADLEAKPKQVQLLGFGPAAEGKEVSDSAEPAMVTEGRHYFLKNVSATGLCI